MNRHEIDFVGDLVYRLVNAEIEADNGETHEEPPHTYADEFADATAKLALTESDRNRYAQEARDLRALVAECRKAVDFDDDEDNAGLPGCLRKLADAYDAAVVESTASAEESDEWHRKYVELVKQFKGRVPEDPDTGEAI